VNNRAIKDLSPAAASSLQKIIEMFGYLSPSAHKAVAKMASKLGPEKLTGKITIHCNQGGVGDFLVEVNDDLSDDGA